MTGNRYDIVIDRGQPADLTIINTFDRGQNSEIKSTVFAHRILAHEKNGIKFAPDIAIKLLKG